MSCVGVLVEDAGLDFECEQCAHPATLSTTTSGSTIDGDIRLPKFLSYRHYLGYREAVTSRDKRRLFERHDASWADTDSEVIFSRTLDQALEGNYDKELCRATYRQLVARDRRITNAFFTYVIFRTNLLKLDVPQSDQGFRRSMAAAYSYSGQTSCLARRVGQQVGYDTQIGSISGINVEIFGQK